MSLNPLALLMFFLFKFIEVQLLSYLQLITLIKGQFMNHSTFLLLIFVIGGSILATLIYVSYRKYQGEKEKKRKRGKDKQN